MTWTDLRWWRAFLAYFFNWQDPTRWEPLSELRGGLTWEADYTQLPGGNGPFQYIGNGWFYSRYKMESTAKYFQWMGEYLEGSLFDWQMADVLDSYFDACKPGDVRGSYEVLTPTLVSSLTRTLIQTLSLTLTLTLTLTLI